MSAHNRLANTQSRRWLGFTAFSEPLPQQALFQRQKWNARLVIAW